MNISDVRTHHKAKLIETLGCCAATYLVVGVLRQVLFPNPSHQTFWMCCVPLEDTERIALLRIVGVGFIVCGELG